MAHREQSTWKHGTRMNDDDAREILAEWGDRMAEKNPREGRKLHVVLSPKGGRGLVYMLLQWSTTLEGLSGDGKACIIVQQIESSSPRNGDGVRAMRLLQKVVGDVLTRRLQLQQAITAGGQALGDHLERKYGWERDRSDPDANYFSPVPFLHETLEADVHQFKEGTVYMPHLRGKGIWGETYNPGIETPKMKLEIRQPNHTSHGSIFHLRFVDQRTGTVLHTKVVENPVQGSDGRVFTRGSKNVEVIPGIRVDGKDWILRADREVITFKDGEQFYWNERKTHALCLTDPNPRHSFGTYLTMTGFVMKKTEREDEYGTGGKTIDGMLNTFRRGGIFVEVFQPTHLHWKERIFYATDAITLQFMANKIKTGHRLMRICDAVGIPKHPIRSGSKHKHVYPPLADENMERVKVFMKWLMDQAAQHRRVRIGYSGMGEMGVWLNGLFSLKGGSPPSEEHYLLYSSTRALMEDGAARRVLGVDLARSESIAKVARERYYSRFKGRGRSKEREEKGTKKKEERPRSRSRSRSRSCEGRETN